MKKVWEETEKGVKRVGLVSASVKVCIYITTRKIRINLGYHIAVNARIIAGKNWVKVFSVSKITIQMNNLRVTIG